MKNKYTLSFVYQIISDTELELREDIFKFGRESWPITRNMLWTTLTTFNQDSLKEIEINRFRFKLFDVNLKVYKNKIKNFYRNIIFNFSIKKFQKKCTAIFFSRSIYLEKISSGMSIDRIIDPIYMTSSINNKCLKIYLDSPNLKDNTLLKGYNYLPDNFNFKSKFETNEYKNLERSCIKFLKSFIAFNSLNNIEEYLIIELKKSIKSYLISKNSSKQFFKNFISLKKIFLSAWYLPETMGIIASARELNISTIEVQHGKQGRFQAAYSGWNIFPENGYVNLPDNFWCWGRSSVSNILKASPERKFHKPILGGYAWPIWYKTFSKNYCKGPIKKKIIKLLFTIQPAYGATNTELLPDGLFDLIKHYEVLYKKSNEKIFELKIRIHPNCLNETFIYLRSRLGRFFYSDLISYTSKMTHCLYDDLLWSNHHITYFSSCALEALIFGIKSAVYGFESYKIYEEEIQNKSLKYFKNNSSEEFLKWFEMDNNISRIKKNDIIDIKFPDPNLIESL